MKWFRVVDISEIFIFLRMEKNLIIHKKNITIKMKLIEKIFKKILKDLTRFKFYRYWTNFTIIKSLTMN